jgi:hypothetical protein
MKYTRYNLKKKKKEGTTFTIVAFGALILSILMGVLIFKGFSNPDSTANKNLPIVKNDNKKAIRYIAIQGGLYKEKEYADEMKKKLSDYGKPFVITEEDKKMRVLLGVYSEEEAIKQIKILTDKGIVPSKMTFEISGSDLCNAEIIEIIDGNLQIIAAASGKEANVQTDAFKKYCLELKAVDNSSKNLSTLKDLKNNVSSLPKEISKDKISDCYIYIYNTLKKFTVKSGT